MIKETKSLLKTKNAKKNDIGKLPMHLLSSKSIKGLVTVLQFGAKEYGERNWEKGLEYSRVFSALLRHLFNWWDGEEFDKESGISHVDHAACNIHFLQHYIKTGTGLDNRPNKLK